MINKSADLMLSSVREQLYVPVCIPAHKVNEYSAI